MKNSHIEWTHHTFNPWRGCTKVSEGCAHCYAETLSKRNPAVLGHWGPGAERVPAKDAYWRQPHQWNKEAAQAGERHRVFCASLADVFDDDGVPIEWLHRLMRTIDETPHLDWLLLTKRPENITPRMQAVMNGNFEPEKTFAVHMPNVWLGVTVENQRRMVERHRWLMKIKAKVRFWSVEPMVGSVVPGLAWTKSEMPDWVICGGESGRGARPMNPEWARMLRDACAVWSVPFLFKQWGNYAPVCAVYPANDEEQEEQDAADASNAVAVEINGGIAEGYQPISQRAWWMDDIGKKAAGRLLDGREWNELPHCAA